MELCKKMVWKSIHSACTIFRISARNMDYAAQLWTKCGLAPVLQTAFEGTEFEVDCGQLLCIWSTWPAQLAEMTRADSAGAHSVVRTMAAFAQHKPYV